MAVIHTIPPQAYTRDVLVKAIEWIGTQPPSVREKATTADLIVSFYIQACRKASAPEAPSSPENFKADLKHLAEGLKFDEHPAPSHPNRFSSYGGEPLFPTVPPPAPPPPKPHLATWNVDPRSLAVARDVQQRLNLSHENEALRLLLTLGAERARELFP